MSRSLHRVLMLVAGVTFVFALPGVNARATYGAQVTADEPQYLLTALSLGEDLDLDIADELADQRFLDFHEIPLNPQTIALDESGQRLSPHDPGLPILLALPMRAFGWQGAKVGLAVIAALTATTSAWVSVRRFGVSPTTAAVVTTALFISPPLTGYATQVYPEMPAALLTMVGVAALTGDRRAGPDAALGVSGRATATAVAAIVCLPWLAVKYAPIAAVLAAALLIGRRPNAEAAAVRHQTNRLPSASNLLWWLRQAGPALAVLVVSGALYLFVHRRIYGGWTVYAAGDHFVDGEFLVVGSDPDYLGRTQRLLGLLLDREFGLMAWAPAYVFVIPSLAALARRRPSGWMLLAGLVGAGWAVATWVALTMHGWWWPGRQVVVILPVVVVILTMLADRVPMLFRSVVMLSAAAVANWFWLVMEASTGRRTLIVDFTETASPFYRLWSPLFPDFRTGETGDAVLTVGWTVLLFAGAGCAWRWAGAEVTARSSLPPPMVGQAAEAAAD